MSMVPRRSPAPGVYRRWSANRGYGVALFDYWCTLVRNDSVPSRPPSKYPRPSLFNRPPLADELFLAEGFFVHCLSLYPRGKPIVPYLQQPQEQGGTLEHVLE